MDINKKDQLNEAIYEFLQDGALTDYLNALGYRFKSTGPDFIDDDNIETACEALTETYSRHMKE